MSATETNGRRPRTRIDAKSTGKRIQFDGFTGIGGASCGGLVQDSHVFTVGWDPPFAQYFLAPLQARTGIKVTHGIVGDARRLPLMQARYTESHWVSISKTASEPLPSPDAALLASLEQAGAPTMRSMVCGDRVLRYRTPEEAFGYATLLAQKLFTELEGARPHLVVGSYDSIHAAVGLGVARRLGIPWVAFAYTVIPDDRTWFCRGLTPDQLVPLPNEVDNRLRQRAAELIDGVRARNVHVAAYRPPATITRKAQQLLAHGRNAVRRYTARRELGVDRYTFPTIAERAHDLARRKRNAAALRRFPMLAGPPKGAFAFFPLHMAPESTVDMWAPMYQDQIGLAVQVAQALPADVALVVKLHFSDPDNYSPAQLERLTRLPGVYVAHPGAPTAVFLERTSLVVGIAGTANLEGALLGKPVLLFGDSPYQHFPATERAVRLDALKEQISRMLALRAPSDDELVEAYATYLGRYMPGRINDWERPIKDAEFDRLAASFTTLLRHVRSSGVRERWYDQKPFAGETVSAGEAVQIETVA